jgi:hypothetical protein
MPVPGVLALERLALLELALFEPVLFEPVLFEPVLFEPVLFEPVLFEPVLFEPVPPGDAVVVAGPSLVTGPGWPVGTATLWSCCPPSRSGRRLGCNSADTV